MAGLAGVWKVCACIFVTPATGATLAGLKGATIATAFVVNVVPVTSTKLGGGGTDASPRPAGPGTPSWPGAGCAVTAVLRAKLAA